MLNCNSNINNITPNIQMRVSFLSLFKVYIHAYWSIDWIIKIKINHWIGAKIFKLKHLSFAINWILIDCFYQITAIKRKRMLIVNSHITISSISNTINSIMRNSSSSNRCMQTRIITSMEFIQRNNPIIITNRLIVILDLPLLPLFQYIFYLDN